MKSSKMRMMIAAAALAVAAGVASAQTNTYKAEIPLAFRAGDKLMQPGTYGVRIVRSSSGAVTVRIDDTDKNSTALLLPIPSGDVPRSWRAAGKPVLSFECADGNCALRGLWDGADVATYKFPGHIMPKSDRQVAELVVTLVKSE